jgi:hypothetical protein
MRLAPPHPTGLAYPHPLLGLDPLLFPPFRLNLFSTSSHPRVPIGSSTPTQPSCIHSLKVHITHPTRPSPLIPRLWPACSRRPTKAQPLHTNGETLGCERLARPRLLAIAATTSSTDDVGSYAVPRRPPRLLCPCSSLAPTAPTMATELWQSPSMPAVASFFPSPTTAMAAFSSISAPT